MKLLEFKPADFAAISERACEDYPLTLGASDIIIRNMTEKIATRSNELLNLWLRDNSVRVSGKRFDGIWEVSETVCGQPLPGHTHFGDLINLEPIPPKPCEHGSKIYGFDEGGSRADCRNCGAKLRPTAWTEVKDE